VKGEAVIFNSFDEFTFPETLTKFNVFGASKFLNQTGKSYYGDIYTSKPDLKKEMIMSKKASLKKNPTVVLNEPEQQILTVCMFLPKEKLHLVPFYDLYALRAQTRAEGSLMQAARKQYKDQLKDLYHRIENARNLA
jgi:hypothetical protein